MRTTKRPLAFGSPASTANLAPFGKIGGASTHLMLPVLTAVASAHAAVADIARRPSASAAFFIRFGLRGKAGKVYRTSPVKLAWISATRANAPDDSGPLLIERAAISNCSSVAMPISTVEIRSDEIT